MRSSADTTASGPKRRDKHYSYDEGIDEPGKLIEEEAVEVEQEIPAEEKRPIERIEENDPPKVPAFEE